MSATTITKNCAINIDHNLGRSAGELSACWVYLKDKDGRLLGLEGAAYIYTTDRKLVPLWTVIFYGGKTLERHMELYNAQRPHLDSRTRRLIRQAIEVDLIREKMLGKAPKTDPDPDRGIYGDAMVYGTGVSRIIVDEVSISQSPVTVDALKR